MSTLNYTQKEDVCREYFDRYLPEYVVETGLYNAHGSCFPLARRALYIAVDLQEENRQAACAAGAWKTFENSYTDMPALLGCLDGPALFWLDAHLVSEAGEPDDSPLLEELQAILDWPHHRRSVLLIDDLRMMGREGWPSVAEVRALVHGVWRRSEWDDIMRLTPLG